MGYHLQRFWALLSIVAGFSYSEVSRVLGEVPSVPVGLPLPAVARQCMGSSHVLLKDPRVLLVASSPRGRGVIKSNPIVEKTRGRIMKVIGANENLTTPSLGECCCCGWLVG